MMRSTEMGTVMGGMEDLMFTRVQTWVNGRRRTEWIVSAGVWKVGLDLPSVLSNSVGGCGLL